MDLEAMDMSRQESLKLDVPKTASVVGCGGTGFWTALALAMSGCERLLLFDSDTVDSSNLNRLPVDPRSVGMPKVDLLKDMLKRLRPSLIVETFSIELDTTTLDLLSGTVFCCTDSVKSQQEIYVYCHSKKLPYQRVGYDGTALNVSRAYPLVLEEEPPRDGYEVTPSWVVPACVAGMLGVASQCYSEITLMDDISTLCHRGTTAVPTATLDKYLMRYLKTSRDLSAHIHNALVDLGYGYCDDCERRDCSDCDRGYCPDCDRGYCPDCDREEPGSYDRGREEGEEHAFEAIESAIAELSSGYSRRLKSLGLSEDIEETLLKWYEAYEQQQQDEEQEVE